MTEGHLPINIKSGLYDRMNGHRKRIEDERGGKISWNQFIQLLLTEWEKLPAT